MGERIISSNGRFFAEILLDEYPENPRDMYDHDTTIVYSSSRYCLGDENIAPEDFVMPANVYAFPVYAYVHSGVALSLSRAVTALDPQGWDSGQSGWIYMPRDKAQSEEDAFVWCSNQIAEFEAYLNGAVYGYTIYRVPEDADPDVVEIDACEELDSCWGYYGYDWLESEVRGLLADYEKEPIQGSLLEVK